MEQGRNTGEDRYTGPGGYSGQGGYPEQGGFGQQNGRMDWGTPSYSNPPVGEGLNKKPEKNKFMLPIIIGGFILVIIIIVVLLLLGWKFVLNGDKEVETIGDYYVTGCKEIMKVREEEDKESKVVTKLDNGEKVSLIEKSEGNYWKVYIEAEEVTGYVDYHYLTNKSDAVMEPVTR